MIKGKNFIKKNYTGMRDSAFHTFNPVTNTVKPLDFAEPQEVNTLDEIIDELQKKGGRIIFNQVPIVQNRKLFSKNSWIN